MSRLDSVIRRLEAQRACLGCAARLIDGHPGPVLELGLGNGRTYDHLREILPEREIYCFDRQIAAHPDCIPDDEHMFLGDLSETLPLATARLGTTVMLAHVDIGSGDKEPSLALGRWLAEVLPGLLAPGAVVVSDQPVPHAGWRLLDLPDGVAQGRYHMQQV
ncbi:MAG: hypothetical protein CMM46_02275 [Rhodospirillaceae bacterium]|mgnify:FL=1|nr:hypothetical protein [Rhodospirillaceae bacterium]|tara:strand:- start:2942 stop:3427 length:486 start_codon:yes stop_codon:yes gene_type:complete